MRMSNSRRTVLITDLECAAALASARMLGRAGWSICSVGSESVPAGRLSRYITRYEQTPSPWNNPSVFAERVARLTEKYAPDLILPISEAAIQCLIRLQSEAPFSNKILAANPALQQLGLSKIRTFQHANSTGLPVVPGVVLQPGDSLDHHPWLVWPAIVRTDNSHNPMGQYLKGHTWIVRDADECAILLRELQGQNLPCLIQEYRDGFGCGAFLLLWEGTIVCWHTHTRLAEIPWRGGISARRRLEFNRDLLSLAERLFSGGPASGVAMVELRVDREIQKSNPEDCYRIVEVNARPWGSMSLALHAQIPFIPLWAELYSRCRGLPSEQDFCVKGLIKDLAPTFDCRTRALICTSVIPGEAQHMLSVIRSWQAGEIDAKSSLSFVKASLSCILNPKTRFDYFVSDDVMPCVVPMARLIQALSRRVLRFFSQPAEHFLWVLLMNLRSPTNLDDFLQQKRVKHILIVCQGNRCRSPFAEKLLRHVLSDTDLKVSSCGLTVNEKHVPERFHGIFQHFGLNPKTHSARSVSEEDVSQADCILLMEESHFLAILIRFGWAAFRKSFFLSCEQTFNCRIEDPFAMQPLRAQQIFFELAARVEILRKLFLKTKSASPSEVSRVSS